MKTVVFSGHFRPVKDIKFNNEDDLLFTASVDRTVTLWSTETNERIGTYSHDASVNCIMPTPDSKYLISGDSFGSVYIWDVCSGEKITKVPPTDLATITSLDLGCSDRQICATMTGRKKDDPSTPIIFDIEEAIKSKKLSDKGGYESNPDDFHVTRVVSNTNNKINHTRFINANKQLLCSFNDGLVELRDIKENKILKSKYLHKQNTQIMDLDVSAKGELALTSGKDSRSVLFDPETLEVLNTFKPENPLRNINSGKISPLFNPSLPEKDQLRHCILGGGQESRNVTFTKSNEGGFEVLIYDMITGEEVGSINGHFSPINSIAISHNGKIIVSGGEEATVRFHPLTPEYYMLKDY